MKRSTYIGFCCLVLLFCFPARPLHGQSTLEEATAFGELELGAPVSSLPFSCARPVWCEGVYESVRVRVWHADGVIQRVDVLYSGESLETGEEIRSRPITLPQAVRSHSIRYGRTTPRMGFGGNDGGARILVDFANGIAYFADTGYINSHVREVRYLPMDYLVMITARVSPLSEHGEWLMKEARSAARYKNLPAGEERATMEPSRTEEEIRPDEIAREFEKVSSEARVYARATLMLSARVLEFLEQKKAPDPLVSSRLRKTFARLNATTNEALCLAKHHPDWVTPQDRAGLPLELAGEAEARMKELASQGFVE